MAKSAPWPARSRRGIQQRMKRIKQGVIILVLSAGLIGALEGVLALCGVRPVYHGEDPYVGFSGRMPLYVEDASGTERHTAENKLDLFNAQRFPEAKGKNTYRIFCVGGSTTYGRPYNDRTAFSGWLRAMLPGADPSKNWEVINAGGISYASYRVALLMEELVQYEPDLFIVYSGHNEFLERRSYPKLAGRRPSALALDSILRGLRSYAVARKIRTSMHRGDASAPGGRAILPEEVIAILDWANGPWEYERGEFLHSDVLEHYRFNLGRMAGIARGAGARIVFVTTPVNLRDCTPFKSTHREDLGGGARLQWEQLVELGGEAKSAADWPRALAALDAACAIDDRYARLHFQRGEVLWALERHEEAKAAFARAVAREHGAMLVDFSAWAEANGEHGTPGSDLFLDHVHPTIEAQRRLSLMLIEEMAFAGILRTSPDWDGTRIAAQRGALIGTLEPRDHANAFRNLSRVLRWGGKFEEAEAHFRRAMELDPTEAESLYLEAEAMERSGGVDEAIALYSQAIYTDTGFGRACVNLGELLSGQGQHNLALGYFVQALEIQPGYVLAYDSVGRELSLLQRHEDAVEIYAQALRLMPEWPEARVHMGLSLAALNRMGDAEAQYRHALRVDPEFAPAHDNLAFLCFIQGRWKAAVHHYREVTRLDPEYKPARRKLRRAQAQMRQEKEARRERQDG